MRYIIIKQFPCYIRCMNYTRGNHSLKNRKVCTFLMEKQVSTLRLKSVICHYSMCIKGSWEENVIGIEMFTEYWKIQYASSQILRQPKSLASHNPAGILRFHQGVKINNDASCFRTLHYKHNSAIAV